MGTVVDAGQAKGEVLSIARDIANRGPSAVRAAKVAIDESLQQASIYPRRMTMKEIVGFLPPYCGYSNTPRDIVVCTHLQLARRRF